jgi:hypothetical protein
MIIYSDDLKDFIKCGQKNDLNDDYNLPNNKAERLKSEKTINLIRVALDSLFKNNQIISAQNIENYQKQKEMYEKKSLAGIYESFTW